MQGQGQGQQRERQRLVHKLGKIRNNGQHRKLETDGGHKSDELGDRCTGCSTSVGDSGCGSEGNSDSNSDSSSSSSSSSSVSSVSSTCDTTSLKREGCTSCIPSVDMAIAGVFTRARHAYYSERQQQNKTKQQSNDIINDNSKIHTKELVLFDLLLLLNCSMLRKGQFAVCTFRRLFV